jgi:hypothetical protein
VAQLVTGSQRLSATGTKSKSTYEQVSHHIRRDSQTTQRILPERRHQNPTSSGSNYPRLVGEEEGIEMSDTPISDSTPHNVVDLGMLCRRLERQLNASNAEIERLTSKVSQLYEGAEEQKQRIKRLEEAGDALMYDNDDMANINRWHKAKEAKP